MFSGQLLYAQTQTARSLLCIHELTNLSSLNAITSPQRGNIVHMQDNLYYYDGSNWRGVWSDFGNRNIGNNGFIGTTNNRDLKLRTYNVERMIIKANGNVGVRLSNPEHQFVVKTQQFFVVANNGRVGVNTNSPTEKLHVTGNILASGTITPDYVFEHYFEGESPSKPDYILKPIEEVKTFVKENKHLPGVPSAQDIKKQGGIIVNKATEINLEKIEELYLYLFELEEENIKIEKRISYLEEKLKELGK